VPQRMILSFPNQSKKREPKNIDSFDKGNDAAQPLPPPKKQPPPPGAEKKRAQKKVSEKGKKLGLEVLSRALRGMGVLLAFSAEVSIPFRGEA